MKRLLFFLFLICLGTGCVSKNIPVVAHRGYSSAAPENTMAAYRCAWKNNISYVELDVYELKDGNIVCVHDSDLSRVSPGASGKKVTAMTLPEIRKYDVGKWKGKQFTGEKVPLLEDVLKEMPRNAKIFLELKSVKNDFPFRFEKLRREYGISKDRITVISFNSAMLKNFNQKVPGFKTNLLIRVYNRKSKIQISAEEMMKRLKQCGATGVGASVSPAIDAGYIKKVKNAGFEFHVWTIDDPETAFRLKKAGVDSITTNEPEKIRSAISN